LKFAGSIVGEFVLRKSFVVSACLFILILLVPLAAAGETTESFTVFTEKEQYYVGEAVNICVRANSIDPNQTITVTDVIVYDPTNVSVAEWHNLSIVLSDTTTIKYVGTVIAKSEGQYTVTANATGCPWTLRAIWLFICQFFCGNKVPELPFGSITATLGLVCATGLYLTKKRRHKPEK